MLAMLQIGVQFAGESERSDEVACCRPFYRRMSAFQTHDPGWRKQFGQSSGKARSKAELGPIVPAQPFDGPGAKFRCGEVGGESVQQLQDRATQLLTIERC